MRINKYLFVFGLVPFLIAILTSVYASIVGYSPIYISYLHHGWYAFVFHIQDWSIDYWWSYILGIALIVMSCVKRGK